MGAQKLKRRETLPRYRSRRNNLDFVIVAVPRDELFDAFANIGLRLVSGELFQQGCIRPSGGHIAFLHGHEVFDPLDPAFRFNRLDKVHQAHLVAIADIDHAEGRNG